MQYILAQFVFRSISPFFSTLLPAIIIFLMSRRLENVRILGLTGGISTGKSTLVRLIKANLNNVTIIDCDEISRKLSEKGQSGYSLIVSLLGDRAEEYLNPLTREIEREKFSHFVFRNGEFRKKLTAKMGQLIFREIVKQVLSNIWHKRNLMMIDAPILYETKVLEHVCYPVVVVGCPEDEQVRRLMKRNEYTEEQARDRIKTQMALGEKKRRCQVYVENNSTEEELLSRFLTKITKYVDKRRYMSTNERW